MCMIFVLLSTGAVTSSQAQVRQQNEMFTDIDLLFDILSAVVNRLDIDDPTVLAREFPGRTFADFDRDRNGAFMTFGAALGLYDLNLAIQQFNHDQVDQDGDGLIGFYELECRFAESGQNLDPTTPQTVAGSDDAAQDCDGDGASNLFEIESGTDPLDSSDTPDNDFEIDAPDLETTPLTAAGDGWEIELAPRRTMRFEGGGFTLTGTFKDK
ncbi:MAG: hypothetical protein VYA30_05825 [Myxococcota bacterium]|nr:hypothetical protein [Myxococcota bacterium]